MSPVAMSAPDEVAMPKCYGCLPATKAVRDRRAKCVDRQAHRPRGPLVAHSHFGSPQFMRECADCHTLVIG